MLYNIIFTYFSFLMIFKCHFYIMKWVYSYVNLCFVAKIYFTPKTIPELLLRILGMQFTQI